MSSFYRGTRYVNTEIEQRVVDEIFSASEAWDNMQILADDIGESACWQSWRGRSTRLSCRSAQPLRGKTEWTWSPFPMWVGECKGEALSVVEPVQREIACLRRIISPCGRTRSGACFLEKMRRGRGGSAKGKRLEENGRCAVSSRSASGENADRCGRWCRSSARVAQRSRWVAAGTHLCI